jgi:hypothetical protein
MLIEIWLLELIIVAVCLSLAAIMFFIDGFKKSEIAGVSRYYLGLGLFFMAFAINGFLDFFEQYAIYKKGQNSLFPNLHLLPGDSSTFFLMIPILQIAFVILAYQIETHVMIKEKKPFTKILALCLVLSLTIFIGPLLNEELQAIWVYVIYGTLVPYAIIVFILAMFYFKIGISGAGVVRSKAFSVFFGLGFIMTGILIDSMYRGYCTANDIEIWWIFPILCKIVAIIGIPLLFNGFKRAN